MQGNGTIQPLAGSRATLVDVSDHGDWSRFLGGTQLAPCEQRYAGYGEKKRAL